MIENNQKNYQVWHHQKALVTWAVGYDEVAKTMAVADKNIQSIIFKRELQLTRHILGFDAKNYHAWQHRQWILSIFRYVSLDLYFFHFFLFSHTYLIPKKVENILITMSETFQWKWNTSTAF